MGIVFQKNKKTGITYAYENTSYWDKEKKQSRAKRKLIGKLDPETGQIIPTRPYNKNEEDSGEEFKRGPVPIKQMRRIFYGAGYLFDQIGKETGVFDDLKATFPDHYKQILSVAYYLILEENNALSRFSHWQKLHHHPYGQDIPSQRSSDIFRDIDEEGRMAFFKKQGKRRMGNEFWAFDVTTSISSYSEALKQVKKGRNKEHDCLPQINLALLFGEQSGLPFYYRKLPGNIADVKTIRQLMAEFDVMGYKKVNVILDRGFYSRANINALYQHHQKFIIGIQLRLKYVKTILEEERENLKLWSNLETQFNTYGVCRTIQWDYEQHRPYKGDVLKSKKRAYLHIFYNPEKAARDQTDMNDYLSSLKRDISENTLKEYRMKDYSKFFEVTETPKRGKKIVPKEEEMLEATRNYGYFSLLSNEVKEPFEALSLYRSKDIVEKAFGNLKDRLNFRRMQVSSELSLNGKLFVEFIALIYLSFVKKKMQDADLFDKWTLQGLLDELDTIELFEAPQHGRTLGEITKKQKEIYGAMGIKPPSL